MPDQFPTYTIRDMKKYLREFLKSYDSSTIVYLLGRAKLAKLNLDVRGYSERFWVAKAFQHMGEIKQQFKNRVELILTPTTFEDYGTGFLVEEFDLYIKDDIRETLETIGLSDQQIEKLMRGGSTLYLNQFQRETLLDIASW